jgi:hypothetical protein
MFSDSAHLATTQTVCADCHETSIRSPCTQISTAHNSHDKGRNAIGAVPTEASRETQHMSMKTHGVSLDWA